MSINRHFLFPRRQHGAVLYVALVMLVLLAMIGLAGMRVSGLQERMSSNYRATNVAFQNAEQEARTLEAAIAVALESPGGVFRANQESCALVFDPLTWSEALPIATVTQTHSKRIDKCFPASSIKLGTKKSEETGNIYAVSALRADSAVNKTAEAVIDTVFIP